MDCSFELLYSLLKKHGFCNSHITTLVKCRSINNVIERSIPLKRLKNYIKYFKRELEIVKPKTVVALSEKTYAILKGMLATLSVRNVQLLKIWSYSYAYRCRKREEFEELFKRLRNTV